jgi:hypothetical protein
MGGMMNRGAIAAKVTMPTMPDEPDISSTRTPRATMSAQYADAPLMAASHSHR